MVKGEITQRVQVSIPISRPLNFIWIHAGGHSSNEAWKSCFHPNDAMPKPGTSKYIALRTSIRLIYPVKCFLTASLPSIVPRISDQKAQWYILKPSWPAALQRGAPPGKFRMTLNSCISLSIQMDFKHSVSTLDYKTRYAISHLPPCEKYSFQR